MEWVGGKKMTIAVLIASVLQPMLELPNANN